MKRLLVLAASLMFVFSASLSFAEGTDKDSWYIGFGIGYGDATISPDSADSWSFSDKNPDSMITIHFGVGAVLNNNVNFGLDVSAIRATWAVFNSEISYQINNYLAALTFFPAETGFFLKAGAGMSALSLEVDSDRDTVTGFAVLGGLGYFVNFGSSFNLGIGLDYSAQFFNDETKFKGSTSFWNAYVSLYWF